jgi:hypothetical protein
MMAIASRRLAVVLAVAATAVAVRADEPAKAAAANPLVGTWKAVSAKYDGKEAARPHGHTHLKHVTPTQFMWALYDKDGKVEAALGGPCTVKGNGYVEVPEYGVGEGLDALKGKPQVFTWKIEGNKWYHTGKLSDGTALEEVWERVEEK